MPIKAGGSRTSFAFPNDCQKRMLPLLPTKDWDAADPPSLLADTVASWFAVPSLPVRRSRRFVADRGIVVCRLSIDDFRQTCVLVVPKPTPLSSSSSPSTRSAQ